MDISNHEWIVRLFPRFGLVDKSELEKFLTATNATLKQNTARDFIIRKGVPVREISCLLSGWTARYVILRDGKRQILDFNTPGSYLGVHALCDEVVQFSVQTLTPTTRLTIEVDALVQAFHSMPAALRIFYAFGCHDLSEADDKVTGLGRRDASGKISRLIAKLWGRLQAAGLSESLSFEFPLKQSHIADAAGLTSVHVNRVLREFRNDGILTLRDGQLEIHDLEALLELADMTRKDIKGYPVLPRGWQFLAGSKNDSTVPQYSSNSSAA